MKRIKPCFGILVLALCLHAQPIVAGWSTASEGPVTKAQVRTVQPAYSTVLTQGRGFWASLAINAGLAAAALAITAATGGVGGAAATAARVV